MRSSRGACGVGKTREIARSPARLLYFVISRMTVAASVMRCITGVMRCNATEWRESHALRPRRNANAFWRGLWETWHGR
ncbi:hypothetical protein PTE31013_01079 [Pandoraea terrigena]|uniref:Uncharacterized protein n=1 Tax=Pandoraea terrigena TaxID=2508292 RepID=A0A5E4SZF5_9BURK|nr:hypothetical protein PTE31013_01079 [Pandoraea terrigena]